MAKLLRSIYVNKTDKTDKVNKFQLDFFVDTALSNPINKRYRETFENKTLLEVYDIMTSKLKADDEVTISNGTKTVTLTNQDWKNIIAVNLSVYTDDTVSILVRGKVSIKPELEINTL